MKLKKYGKGGKYDMYNKGGVNPKKKKMTPAEREAEMTKMAGVAKERLEEMAGEKAYLAKRKVADREYKQALKEGATPEQAAKIAEKYLSQGGKMYLKGGQVKLDKNKDGKITGEDFKIMKAKKKYNKGGSVDPEKEKAKKAAEAEAKRRLQNKMRKVYGDVTEASKEAVSRSSKRAEQSGKPLSEGQKRRAVSKQRKMGNVLDGSLKGKLSPQEKLQNIKADLRNLQSGKEELVYVGRPDRYGVDADLKNKPIGRVYDDKKSTLKLRKYKKGGKNNK